MPFALESTGRFGAHARLLLDWVKRQKAAVAAAAGETVDSEREAAIHNDVYGVVATALARGRAVAMLRAYSAIVKLSGDETLYLKFD